MSSASSLFHCCMEKLFRNATSKANTTQIYIYKCYKFQVDALPCCWPGGWESVICTTCLIFCPYSFCSLELLLPLLIFLHYPEAKQLSFGCTEIWNINLELIADQIYTICLIKHVIKERKPLVDRGKVTLTGEREKRDKLINHKSAISYFPYSPKQ